MQGGKRLNQQCSVHIYWFPRHKRRRIYCECSLSSRHQESLSAFAYLQQLAGPSPPALALTLLVAFINLLPNLHPPAGEPLLGAISLVDALGPVHYTDCWWLWQSETLLGDCSDCLHGCLSGPCQNHETETETENPRSTPAQACHQCTPLCTLPLLHPSPSSTWPSPATIGM